ncbi:MAG: tripartite tricarboxylate transporter substrate binding protein [Betaproteobacteria bacterium]|nr:tripartite tricarboxylate transporter substrate binding protein [Betaproteobacteria bacterium]
MRVAACWSLVAAGLTALAHADDYPDRPIRVVVGFSPGGGADAAARVVGQTLRERWGHPAVVDNRPGAGGNLAADLVAKASPDGYTLLVSSPGPIAVNPALYGQLPYDPQKDLAPVTLIAQGANVLVVHPSMPATSVSALIELARSKPRGLNYASSGVGSTPHLCAELFKLAANIKGTHVPYKGAGPAVIDLVAGRVDFMLVSIPSILSQVKAKRLKALAVTSRERSSVLPELPTLAEAGLPGYEATVWWGLWAPAGAPAAIVRTLNTTVVSSLKDAAVRERLARGGAEVVGNSAQEFAAFIRAETLKWSDVIKKAGIRRQ